MGNDGRTTIDLADYFYLWLSHSSPLLAFSCSGPGSADRTGGFIAECTVLFGFALCCWRDPLQSRKGRYLISVVDL